jgi:serine/threonine-protein kinase
MRNAQAGKRAANESAAITGERGKFAAPLAVPPPPPAKITRPPLAAGETVAGYELVHRAKSGGMGSLWVARRAGAGPAKYVAIKVIHPHLAENEDFVKMFLDEGRLTARIQHPNVIALHDVGVERGNYFMVMELVTGCSLVDACQAIASRGRRIKPELAVAIIREVALGLHAAHELRNELNQPLDLVHRDVSPDNILLGVHGSVKLIDFGIAKASERLHHTRTPTLKGKLRYLAPEQLGGHIDRRTDVFALGIVLWELVTGQRIYDGASEAELLDRVREPVIVPPSEIAPELTPAFDKVIASMTATHPDQRPQTAADAATLLLAALPGARSMGSGPIAQLASATTTAGVGVSEGIDATWPPADMTSLTTPRAAPSPYNTGRMGPKRTGGAGGWSNTSIAIVSGIVVISIAAIATMAWHAGRSQDPEIRVQALTPSPTTRPRILPLELLPPSAAEPPAIASPVPVPVPVPDPVPVPAPVAPPTRARTASPAAPRASTPRPRGEARAAVVDGTTLATEL